MRRYFTKTFFKFLICFLILLGLSFGIIILVAQSEQSNVSGGDANTTNASTNTAHTSPTNF